MSALSGSKTAGKSRAEHGLTLIELSAALLIMGVVLALGVPMIQDMRINAISRSASLELQDFFTAAKSQAITSQRNVELVRTTKGWDIRVGDVTAADFLTNPLYLKRQFEFNANHNLNQTFVTTPAGLDTAVNAIFRFTPTGMFQHVNTAGPVVQALDVNIALCVTGVGGGYGRTIQVRRMGQIRSFRSTANCTAS